MKEEGIEKPSSDETELGCGGGDSKEQSKMTDFLNELRFNLAL